MEKPEKLYTNIKQEIGKLKLESVESTREELNTLKNDIKSKIAKENYRTVAGIWSENLEKFKYILGDQNISMPKSIDDSTIFIKKILNKSGFNKANIIENNEISTEYLSSIISIQKSNNLKIDGIFGNQMVKYIYENMKNKEENSTNLSNLSEYNPKVSVPQSEVVSANSEIKLNGGVDNLSETSMQLQIKQEYEELKRTLPEKLELKEGIDFDIQKLLIDPLKDLKKMLNGTIPRNENQLEEFSNYFSNNRQNKLTDEAKNFIINFPDDLENDQNIKNIPIINSKNINDPKIQLAFGKGLIYIVKKLDPKGFSTTKSNFIEGDNDKIIIFSKKTLYELSKMLNGINLHYNKLQSKLNNVNIPNSQIMPISEDLQNDYKENQKNLSEKEEGSKKLGFFKKIGNLFRKKDNQKN